jgi:uncharacterized protein (DUF885 family)
MKNTKLSIFVVATFAVLAIGSVAAFGFGNGFMKGLSEDDKEEMQAFHEQLQTAIENKDFEAWKSLMESQLTEENFNAMVEMHEQMSEMRDLREQIREAMENNDAETAEDLRAQLQELMPEKSNGMGMGHMKGFMQRAEFADDAQ